MFFCVFGRKAAEGRHPRDLPGNSGGRSVKLWKSYREKKCVVLGVTGGIAAYKMAYVASALRKTGADVHVIMTENATQFITPLTF